MFSKFPNASFGFIGSPTEPELEERKINRTKRFEVYDKFARFYFNPDNFEHVFDHTVSAYILLNKSEKAKNPKLLENIRDMFNDTYDIENSLLRM